MSKKMHAPATAATIRQAEPGRAKYLAPTDAADREDHPVPLSKQEELLLMEAVRRGESAQRKQQDTMLEYGQWLLDTVFGGDTTAALDPRSKNPVWAELVRRAGGPTLHVSTRFLSVALRIAAYDKRITDESWRLLDVGRKELLLPLEDVPALREAARHVIRFDLTHKAVLAHVTARLAVQGESRRVSWTAPQMARQLARLHAMLEERAPLRRLRVLRSHVSDEQRCDLLARTRALQKALTIVARELRK